MHNGVYVSIYVYITLQLSCMFKETCMSQYCEYSVVCMLHAGIVAAIDIATYPHNMQTNYMGGSGF